MTLLILLFASCLIHVNSHILSRIAFGSCYNPSENGPVDNIWEVIQSQHPNQLILLGDNIYADKRIVPLVFNGASPEMIKRLYQKFADNSKWKNLQESLKTIGSLSQSPWGETIHATFDDHDYGLNNGDKNFKFRNESQQLFWDFINVPSDSKKRSQSGVYTSKTVVLPSGFVYKIILLDARSNKDTKRTFYGDFLGDEQWKWLFNELFDESIGLKLPDLFIIGSGIQILPTDKLAEETWNEFPLARERLLRLLDAVNKISNVIIISGDVHSSELLYGSCGSDSTKLITEFTSSGFSHSVTYAYSKKSSTDRNYIMQSRMSLIQIANDAYEALGPHSYRLNRYADYYQGPNFGLIDIIIDESNHSNYLDLHIMSYTGEHVRTKRMLLTSPIEYHDSSFITVKKSVQHLANAKYYDLEREFYSLRRNVSSPLTSAMATLAGGYQQPWSICQPVTGPIPKWRKLLMNIIVAACLMIGLLIPLCVVGWFVFASLWYVFYESEQRRREKLMKLHRKHE